MLERYPDPGDPTNVPRLSSLTCQCGFIGSSEEGSGHLALDLAHQQHSSHASHQPFWS